MPRCHVGLGGNLGSVPATFGSALDLLDAADTTVRMVSRFYRTAAVGGQAGGEFLNAAAELDTRQDPLALLDRLQAIEAQLGRTRDIRWGPRTIDLDLLLYDDDAFETPRLTVPHPAAWYRRFALDPLTEIAPDLIHPVKNLSIRRLRDRLLARPLPVALMGPEPQVARELVHRLAPQFQQVRFTEGPIAPDRGAYRSPDVPAFIFWLANQPTEGCEDAGFASLPPLPRLSLPPSAISAEDFVRSVLLSALDHPTVSTEP